MISSAVLIVGTEILQVKRKLVKNLNCREADQLAIYNNNNFTLSTVRNQNVMFFFMRNDYFLCYNIASVKWFVRSTWATRGSITSE